MENKLSKSGIVILSIFITVLIATPILFVKVWLQTGEITTLRIENKELQQEVKDFELCTLHTVVCDFEKDFEPYGD